jgi:hypothetical protein
MLSQTKRALGEEIQNENNGNSNDNEIANDNDVVNLNLNRIIGMITKPVATSAPHEESYSRSYGSDEARESWSREAANARLISTPTHPITTILSQHATPVEYFTLDSPVAPRFAQEEHHLGVGTATATPRPAGPVGASGSAAPAAAAAGGGANNNPTYILPIDPYNYMPFFNSYSNVNPFASFYPTPQSPLANNPTVPWSPQMYANPNMLGPNPLYPWTNQPFPLYVSPSTQDSQNPQLLYPFGMSPFPPPPAPTNPPPAWLQLAQSRRAVSIRGAAVTRHLRTSHPEDSEQRVHSIDQSVVHVHPTYASMHPSCEGCSFLEIEK